jgi:hypothetical protein
VTWISDPDLEREAESEAPHGFSGAIASTQIAATYLLSQSDITISITFMTSDLRSEVIVI